MGMGVFYRVGLVGIGWIELSEVEEGFFESSRSAVISFFFSYRSALAFVSSFLSFFLASCFRWGGCEEGE